MVTEFASRLHTWRLVSISIGGFRYHAWNRAKKQCTKASQYFVTLFQAMPVKNVWPLRSQSAASQVSAVLFYAQTTKFRRAQICVGDMRVSHLQAKGRQHNLSQNIGPAIAGSARPASPALSVRNECVKKTVLLKLF